MAVIALIAQWVPNVDEKAAEDSFFKINQAATPIDPTERRILRARDSAHAIAARAIARGATGHKYWSNYPPPVQEEIESLAKHVHAALYDPPMGEGPVRTMDLPVAGRGYNALPFVFDLVNWANGVPDPSEKDIDKVLSADPDGRKTIEFLKNVRSTTHLLTGHHAASIGVHPVVYFYGRGGDFQPGAFLSTAEVIKRIADESRLREFTRARRQFEDFLLSHKEFITRIIQRTGAGRRSHNRLVRYLDLVLRSVLNGNGETETLEILHADVEFGSMVTRPLLAAPNPSGAFNRRTKSASFLEAAVNAAVRCALCGALVHRNSMHSDHITPKSAGGKTDMTNAQVAHPYCDSSKGS